LTISNLIGLSGAVLRAFSPYWAKGAMEFSHSIVLRAF